MGLQLVSLDYLMGLRDVLCVLICWGVGMDMTVALLKWMYGDRIDRHVNMMEYAPHLDPSWDPYSVVWNVSW